MHNPESDHDSLRHLVRQSTNLGLPMGALHALAELKIRHPARFTRSSSRASGRPK